MRMCSSQTPSNELETGMQGNRGASGEKDESPEWIVVGECVPECDSSHLICCCLLLPLALLLEE